MAANEGSNVQRDRLIDHFHEGLDAYRRRDWRRALSWFERVLRLAPDDSPSKVYIRRCRLYIQAPPPKDWDGIYVLKNK